VTKKSPAILQNHNGERSSLTLLIELFVGDAGWIEYSKDNSKLLAMKGIKMVEMALR
jgi:hypothetical protein